MLRPRIIPCLLIKDASLIKTVKFKNPKYIGDPVNTVKIFNELEVDELMFLDIYSSLKKNKIKAQSCVYFEDLEKNLENAHKYGITTIHIKGLKDNKKSTQPFIDFRFKSILEALNTINKTFN